MPEQADGQRALAVSLEAGRFSVLVEQVYKPSLRRVLDPGPLQVSIKNTYAPGAELPGALGKGQAIATALGNLFKFWASLTVLGAVIADQSIGKFKAISIYIIGPVLLVATATPAAIKGAQHLVDWSLRWSLLG
ncbi:uncharacterized protein ATNIH1004_009611 [Aspergillus tanneri]|uniref:Uncharacterized protein n=1 Tax=Aspergillus tanneri TaxID=1220188 RepID=A0A5M9MB21_9EURO|nr:uncharacterized protein ATNIH1004_009611 [Aspergillus tanneri]KAA8642856.1 hypothetical protein ATNIH1004_009611 [Aspergillus tanneri]